MPRTARTAGALLLVALGLVGTPAVADAQGCVDAQLTPDGANAAQVAAATRCFVNAERARAGLPALAAQPQLRRAALAHSRDMVARRFFDHRGSDGSDVTTRVRRSGYLRGAARFALRENLAWGTGARGTAAATVRGWMASPAHRAAILDRTVRDAGLGVVAGSPVGGRGATFTLVLGTRR